MAGFFQKISEGLGKTREKFQEQFNVLLDKGPNLDDEFWDGLEEALISADIGAPATMEIIDNLQDESRRKALPDAYAVFDLLNERIAEQFHPNDKNILEGDSAVLLFVGINGTGKTTTVGKIAKEATDAGLKVIMGSADTFRAAAIEQLEVWAKRANVEIVSRERGSDPASVCFATIERAEELGSELILIDTAGRLHTSKDLMNELEKVCKVTRKRANMPVYVILVIDATTGQNGLMQAKEFNKFLNLDALIVTKLDGTAKGGIALAVSKELKLPILKIGVGEKIEDLRNFNAKEFARAFVGNLDSRTTDEQESNLSSSNESLNAELQNNRQEYSNEDNIDKNVEDNIVQNDEDTNEQYASIQENFDDEPEDVFDYNESLSDKNETFVRKEFSGFEKEVTQSNYDDDDSVWSDKEPDEHEESWEEDDSISDTFSYEKIEDNQSEKQEGKKAEESYEPPTIQEDKPQEQSDLSHDLETEDDYVKNNIDESVKVEEKVEKIEEQKKEEKPKKKKSLFERLFKS